MKPAWQTLLLNTEIMTEEGVTVGGMLLFGTTPNRFLPIAGIDAAAFPWRREGLCGARTRGLARPMTPLLMAAAALVENGLVEQALEFVRRNSLPKPPWKTAREGSRCRPIRPKSSARPW